MNLCATIINDSTKSKRIRSAKKCQRTFFRFVYCNFTLWIFFLRFLVSLVEKEKSERKKQRIFFRCLFYSVSASFALVKLIAQKRFHSASFVLCGDCFIVSARVRCANKRITFFTEHRFSYIFYYYCYCCCYLSPVRIARLLIDRRTMVNNKMPEDIFFFLSFFGLLSKCVCWNAACYVFLHSWNLFSAFFLCLLRSSEQNICIDA